MRVPICFVRCPAAWGAIAFSAVAITTDQVSAGYIATALVGGQSSVIVPRGRGVDIDLVLTADQGTPAHDSVILSLLFSSPGLRYLGYEWAEPFPNQTDILAIFDDSVPRWQDLPAMLTPDLLRGPGFPADAVDVQLSNIAADGAFGLGRLVTLHLEVPGDYAGPDLIQVSAIPDTFALGFEQVPAVAGNSLVIIVPTPGVAFTFVFVGLSIPARRRLRRRLCAQV